MALLTNGVTIVFNLKQNENDIRNSAAHILLRLLHRTLKPSTLSQDREAVWQPWYAISE